MRIPPDPSGKVAGRSKAPTRLMSAPAAGQAGSKLAEPKMCCAEILESAESSQVMIAPPPPSVVIVGDVSLLLMVARTAKPFDGHAGSTAPDPRTCCA